MTCDVSLALGFFNLVLLIHVARRLQKNRRS